jgi:hypothetical protein
VSPFSNRDENENMYEKNADIHNESV